MARYADFRVMHVLRSQTQLACGKQVYETHCAALDFRLFVPTQSRRAEVYKVVENHALVTCKRCKEEIKTCRAFTALAI